MMNVDRALVARAVFAGQLPASVLTEQDIVDIELNTMGLIVERKLYEGKIVFADHDTLH
jgi:hypothetical protein